MTLLHILVLGSQLLNLGILLSDCVVVQAVE